VLADVHMPGADGYEVCAAARQMLPGVPVMLLVGTFELFDADRAAQVGAAGHLKKPFDSQELLRRVRELLAAGKRGAPVLPTEGLGSAGAQAWPGSRTRWRRAAGDERGDGANRGRSSRSLRPRSRARSAGGG
jgi:DNA-binding response OmpR family regulator